MTTTQDVHDMLGISTEVASQPKPKKKGKSSVKRPDGMAREIFSLLGERAPPIPVAEPAQYKAKRRVGSTDVAWRETPFYVTSRKDGLLLQHWRKAFEDKSKASEAATTVEASAPSEPATEADELPANVIASRDRTLARISKRFQEQQKGTEPSSEKYKFSKYNVTLEGPKYDDAVYNSHLKSDDWSREETDYLMELYTDYYGKWAVIVDRWEYKQPGISHDEERSTLEVQAPGFRTMEEIKSRFYEVSAKLMAVKTPVTNMSTNEFNVHEKMAKFDSKQEIDRKKQKEAMLVRTKGERDEERHLLAELERMYKRQEQFEVEVRDLRHRLDHSLTDDIPNAQLYTSSQEITSLFQKFIQRDKNNKLRRSLNEPAGAASSPTSATASANVPVGAGQATGNKRSSLAYQSSVPDRRVLSPADEIRFGVSTHERLVPGITFKSDRIAKARQAKSQSKTEKIAVMLSELGIPDVIQMPTNAICVAMEELVKKIVMLIDQRKLYEKEENDFRVAKELKMLRSGDDQGQQQTETHEETQTQETIPAEDDGKASDAEAEANLDVDIENEEDEEEDEEDEDVDADADVEKSNDADETNLDTKNEPGGMKDPQAEPDIPRPSTRGNQTRSQKRSASVLSASSTGSRTSRATSKRLKAARG